MAICCSRASDRRSWIPQRHRTLRISNSPPSILGVNHESRTEALKIYSELSIGPSLNVVGYYVNLSRDTIYLRSGLTIETDIFLSMFRQWTTLSEEHARFRGIVHPKDSSYAWGDEEKKTRFSEFIYKDLMNSTDTDAILANLHDDFTWMVLFWHFVDSRHEHPHHIKKLTLTTEVGEKPLRQSMYREIVPYPGPLGSGKYNQNRIVDKILLEERHRYVRTSEYWNTSSERDGLDAVMTLDISCKVLWRSRKPRLAKIRKRRS